jgi:hypothetical protein
MIVTKKNPIIFYREKRRRMPSKFATVKNRKIKFFKKQQTRNKTIFIQFDILIKKKFSIFCKGNNRSFINFIVVKKAKFPVKMKKKCKKINKKKSPRTIPQVKRFCTFKRIFIFKAFNLINSKERKTSRVKTTNTF